MTLCVFINLIYLLTYFIMSRSRSWNEGQGHTEIAFDCGNVVLYGAFLCHE